MLGRGTVMGVALAQLAALAAAQSNPAPASGLTGNAGVACTIKYTAAYMSTLNGECSQLQCSYACQQKIDDVRNKCKGQKYNETDPITGQISERSFMQKSIQALQLMGPADCDYSVGFEHCDSSCSMANITGGDATTDYEKYRCISVDPISGQSDPLASWHSCEGVCREQFEHLTDSCGTCQDPIMKKFMDNAARKLVTCTTGNSKDCGALKDGLNSACCAGPDGIVGNGDDTCNIKNGTAPQDCTKLGVCSAAVQQAGTTCPHSFTSVPAMMGLFLDCGGNLQQLFAAAPVDTQTAVYCPDGFSGGIALPGSYDGHTTGGGRRLSADEEQDVKRAKEILAYFSEHPEMVPDDAAVEQSERRALQANPLGPGTPDDPQCAFDYQAAFTATISGVCSHHTCTADCQQVITKMLSSCKGQSFNFKDPETNMTVTRAFSAKAVNALQLLGPADCAYHMGYQECGEQCNIVNASKALGQECAIFFMGVDFHEWVGCGRSKANTPGHCDADPDDPNWCLPQGGEATKAMCWERYVDYVEKCSGCTDPFIQRFLRTTAAATANTHCESCSNPQQISDKINHVCCAGADGILGNDDDPCDAKWEYNRDSNDDVTRSVQWHVPNTCESDGACMSYVNAIAMEGCPSLFISDGDQNVEQGGVGLGIFADCGGDVSALLKKGKSCDQPHPPAHAALGSCNETALPSGTPCEMTCQTGWCVGGRQPQCFDGQVRSSMHCEPQAVQSCLFPPNGGCDPHTTCSDATNLFGTKLVQCSECPRGYFGSGRSGCFDINECTVMRNGGCDIHTTCHNFDGGYNCSDCPAPLVGNSFLDGGCHTPSKPPSTAASIFALGNTAGTCTGICPGNDCASGLSDVQLQTRDACDAKNTMANRCDCVWTPPDTAESNIWFVLLMCLCVAASVGAVCALCSKKQYKTEGGNMEKIDVGSIGTGPSIYDSTWAR